MACWRSSTTQTCFSGSYGLTNTECGRRIIESHCVQLSMMLPVGVDHEQVVLPAGVDAELALPAIPPVAPGVAGARHRTDRRIAERCLRHREGNARADVRIRHFLRPFEQRQFAAHQDVDAVRRLGKDALHRAPRPLLVARELRQRLRPVLRHRVRAGLILAAFRRLNRGRCRRGAVGAERRTCRPARRCRFLQRAQSPRWLPSSSHLLAEA